MTLDRIAGDTHLVDAAIAPVARAPLRNAHEVMRDRMRAAAPALRVRRLTPTAQLPSRGSAGAIGYDLFADVPGRDFGVRIPPGERCRIGTGIAVAIPAGHYLRIAPRSGLAAKEGVDVLAGVCDPDYRGELVAILHNFGRDVVVVTHAQRIAQAILEMASVLPVVEVAELDDTARGAGGFGGTGR